MEEITEDYHAQRPTKRIKSSRARYPNWEKQETISLIRAYQRQIEEYNRATNKGRVVGSEQKWDKISSLCAKEGVSRDAEQCRKRWQDLLKNYKRIKFWNGTSFWHMQPSTRKESDLPGTFDKEIYDCIDQFMQAKLSFSKSNLDEDRDISIGQLTYVEAHVGPSPQDDSWERTMSPRTQTGHNQISITDTISETVENSIRLAQEQCSAQFSEVLADALLQVADAIKKVAESIRKRPR